ncbi:hypothetical protein [Cryobacterium roopkundense]|uniref:Uncharacterized protein n=1 Tax=Cryobacterium roopkundense TaxID=1001240 RepID=A0A7W9A087_9MICO|nr:hypothetical protein [Cryobacterium roopkundense]MBB5643474.1 hypothetical protein [Cryobacterium roopkundense]
MSRIDIVYGGRPYSLGGRDVESIQVEIDSAITAGVPYWLPVNAGEGRYEDAFLLIAPGIPIALVHAQVNGVSHENDTAESFIPDGL